MSVITGDIREWRGGRSTAGATDRMIRCPSPPRITLTLVRGTALDILDLTGEARASAILLLASRRTAGSGTVTAGRIGDADIRIDGGGQVEIAAIDGNARLTFPARARSGSQAERSANWSSGSAVGSIDVMAPAASAIGSIRGAGTVLLGSNVATTPRIEASSWLVMVMGPIAMFPGCGPWFDTAPGAAR
ncbi:MAG: hypothetical protein R3D03_04575 [Geminicoccaceae bacterium]